MATHTLLPTGQDDTELLRQLLEHTQPGDAVQLAGVYSVAGTVPLTNSGVTFVCHGATIHQKQSNTPTLLLRGVSDVDVLGLSLVGLGTERPWLNGGMEYNRVAGLAIHGGMRVRILGCRFRDHAGGSIHLDGMCDTIAIANTSLRGVGAPAIAYLANGYDAAISGASNSIRKRGVSVTGCDISGHCLGVLIPGDCELSFTGNTLHDIPGQHGIYLTQGGSVCIATNLITRCAMNGVKVQHQLPDDTSGVISISSNVVSQCGSFGIGIIPAGEGHGHKQRNVSITGNNVSECEYGLYVRGVEGAVVVGNRTRQCKHGIHTQEFTGICEHNVEA